MCAGGSQHEWPLRCAAYIVRRAHEAVEWQDACHEQQAAARRQLAGGRLQQPERVIDPVENVEQTDDAKGRRLADAWVAQALGGAEAALRELAAQHEALLDRHDVSGGGDV